MSKRNRKPRLTKKQRKLKQSRIAREVASATGVDGSQVTVGEKDGKRFIHSPEGLSADGLRAMAERLVSGGMAEEMLERERADRKKWDVVDLYLVILEGLRTAVRSSKTQKATRTTSDLWARISNARIVDLGAEAFQALYHEVDVYTTEEIAGQIWDEPNDSKPNDSKEYSGEEATIHLVKISKAGEQMVLDTEFLPFDHVFFMFGPATVHWSPMQAYSRYGIEQNAALGGILVSHDGLVCEIGLIGMDENGIVFDPTDPNAQRVVNMKYAVHHRAKDDTHGQGIWLTGAPPMLLPWLVPEFIRYVNEFRRFVVENKPNLEMQQRFNKKKKRIGIKHPVPKPYYTVYLKSETVIEDWNKRKRLPRKSYDFTYRFDVRGHERCLIKRGPLPIKDKDRHKLIKRGYTVYTIRDMLKEDMDRLAERKVPPKKRDEWLAIKTVWIEADIRPHNQSLPYVPAVRKKPAEKRNYGPASRYG
jgi:hypothetical protein